MFTEYDRKAGAGCLVAAGLLGLLPALFVGWWFAIEMRSNAQSAFSAIQWSSLGAFWKSWQYLLSSGSGSEHVVLLVFLIIVGYFTVIWQWIALVMGWRTLFYPRRLWAVSSGYFFGVIVFLLYMGYAEFRRLKEHNVQYSFEDAMTMGAIACAIPAAFLSITVPLWLSTPRPHRGNQ